MLFRVDHVHLLFTYRPKKSPEKRSINLAVINAGSPSAKKPISKVASIIKKERQSLETSEGKFFPEETVNKTDPNITLISVFSSDAPPNIRVQRSTSASSNTSKSSQLFSLFRIPKNVDGNSLPSSSPSSHILDGTVVDRSSNASKTLTEGSKRGKQDKNNRIVSFVRYLFCHLVPARADATLTPIIVQTPIEENQPPPPPPPPRPSTPVPAPVKVYCIFSLKNRISLSYFILGS